MDSISHGGHRAKEAHSSHPKLSLLLSAPSAGGTLATPRLFQEERTPVITCPNCGAPVNPQAQMCPRCQAQLLPPAMPTPAGYPYGGSLETTDNMPEWVRVVQGQAYSQQPQPHAPSAAAPGSRNAALGYAQVPPQQPQGSLSLSEMINEENLPEWLRGAADAPDAPAIPPAPRTVGNGAGYAGNNPASGYSAYAVDPRPTGNMATPSVSYPYPAPPSGSPGASASSLLDESALPDWLRQSGANGANGQQGGATPPQPQPIQPVQSPQGMATGYSDAQGQMFPQPEPSSAFPRLDQRAYGQQAPQPDHQMGMGGGIAAQSLLDQRALPGWLGGEGAAPYTPQQSERVAGMGMPANSLVDEHALPQWLRNEPATPSQRVPAVQPGVVSQWITGSRDEPLPTWLNQVYSDAPPASSAAFIPAQPFARPAGTPAYAQSPESAAQPLGMTARQFVEESALPEWLRAQGATPTTAQNPIAPPVPGAPANGYGAAPSFAAPGDQFAYRSSQPASGYLAPNGQANPAAQANGQASGAMSGQLRAMEPERAPEATFSAYDLIDPDALPSWVNGAPKPNGANATNGRIPAAPNGTTGANGGNNATGTGALGHLPGGGGWDDVEANEPPITPTSRRPTTLGQTMSRSGRVPVPPSSQASQLGHAPYEQASTGRMRLDDLPGGARNQPRQQAPGRPAPQRAPQHAQGTGSLRQPPPEQHLHPEELPGWLRAGTAHAAPPEASYDYGQGYDAAYGQNGTGGFPDSAQEEPIWDDADWGLPAQGNTLQGAQSQQYTARAPMQGRRPPAGGAQNGGQPDDRRKRGWRRIFGR